MGVVDPITGCRPHDVVCCPLFTCKTGSQVREPDGDPI
jgi:hypothetical protein